MFLKRFIKKKLVLKFQKPLENQTTIFFLNFETSGNILDFSNKYKL